MVFVKLDGDAPIEVAQLDENDPKFFEQLSDFVVKSYISKLPITPDRVRLRGIKSHDGALCYCFTTSRTNLPSFFSYRIIAEDLYEELDGIVHPFGADSRDMNMYEEPEPSVSNPKEVEVNGEVIVGEASLNRLILVLTDAEYTNSHFQKVFLRCYPLFVSPSLLLRKLMERFFFPIPPNLQSSLSRRYQIVNQSAAIAVKSVALMEQVIRSKFFSCDSGTQVLFAQFIDEVLPEFGLFAARTELLEAWKECSEKRYDVVSAVSDVRARVEAIASKAPSNPNTPFSVTPMIAATHLTILEEKFIETITAEDFVDYLLKGKDKSSGVLADMIKRNEQLSSWVASSVVQIPAAGARAERLGWFLDVISSLLLLRNYNTAFALYHGVTHVSLARLRATFDSLSLRSKQVWADVSEWLMGENNYECGVSRTLELTLRDLSVSFQQTQVYTHGRKVNFERCVRVHDAIDDVLSKCGVDTSAMKKDPGILAAFAVAPSRVLDERRIYDLSLQHEPVPNV